VLRLPITSKVSVHGRFTSAREQWHHEFPEALPAFAVRALVSPRLVRSIEVDFMLKMPFFFIPVTSTHYPMKPKPLLLERPAALVFTFKTPIFEINKLISVSLAAVPFVTLAICCPALSHACVDTLFVTLSLLASLFILCSFFV
jgi:hypothetical protein